MRGWTIGLGGGALLVFGAAAAFGPAAPWLVGLALHDAQLWRLGRLQLSNPSGWHLGDLRYGSLALRDADGVYATAEEVAIAWSPWALLSGDLAVQTVRAKTLTIHRLPTLDKDREAQAGSFDVSIADLHAERVQFGEAVLGAPLAFSARGEVVATAGALKRARLQARGEGHGLNFHFDDSNPQDTLLTVDLSPQSALARRWTLDAPINLTAAGRLAGATRSGNVEVLSDGATWASGAFADDAGGLRAEASVRATANPLTRPLAARIGEDLTLDLVADAETSVLRASGQNLQARIVAAPLIEAINAPMQVEVSARDGATLLDQKGLGIGAIELRGAVRHEAGAWRFSGAGVLDRFGVASHSASANGPVTAVWRGEAIDVDADLAVSGRTSVMRAVLGDARLRTKARWRQSDSRIEALSLAFTSRTGEVSATGSGSRVSGKFDLPALNTVAPDWRGGAQGEFVIDGEAFSIDAVGRNVRAPPAIAAMVGAAPRLAARGRLTASAVDVALARIESRQVRLGARGRIGAAVDMRVEAVARGPLDAAGLAIDGEVVATGTVSGSMASPRIALQAHADELASPIGDLQDVTASLAYQDGAGRLSVNGQSAAGSVDVRSPIRFDARGFSADNVEGVLFGARLNGAVRLGEAGEHVDLTFAADANAVDPSGAFWRRGALTGRVGLANGALDAQLVMRDARIGATEIAEAAVSLSGPLGALTLRGDARGEVLEKASTLAVRGGVASTPQGLRAELRADAQWAGEVVTTSQPIVFDSAGASWRVQGAVSWSDGQVGVSAKDDADGLDLRLTAKNAALAPVFAALGEPGGGRLDGEAVLTRKNDDLAVLLDVRGTGVSIRRRIPDPVDFTMRGALRDARIAGTLTGASQSGFQATVDADLPSVLSPTPAGALASASWRASGPVETVWSAFGGLGQEVSGTIESAGNLQWSDGRWRGDGEARLRGGALSDYATGLALQNIDADVVFDGLGAQLTSFSGRDRQGGMINGSGVIMPTGDASLSLRLDQVQVVDRADVRVSASGPLTLAIDADGGELSGALRINSAEIAPPRPTRSRALLEVREINAPQRAQTSRAPQWNASRLAFDIAIDAPSRVFVRGRGLQSEWSLNAVLRGDAQTPLLFGEGRALRGDFRLAGRPFDLVRGRVQFNGPIEDARLDVEASLSTPDLEAQVQVSGAIAAPEVALTSTPSLPPDEVLPQILFGRSIADLSPVEAAQIAASLAELGGEAAFDITGAARALIQLDRLDVRPSEQGVAVAGGKYINRDVYLELARTDLGGAEAALEWRVRPRLFLISRFSPQGDARVSVRWRSDD